MLTGCFPVMLFSRETNSLEWTMGSWGGGGAPAGRAPVGHAPSFFWMYYPVTELVCCGVSVLWASDRHSVSNATPHNLCICCCC